MIRYILFGILTLGCTTLESADSVNSKDGREKQEKRIGSLKSKEVIHHPSKEIWKKYQDRGFNIAPPNSGTIRSKKLGSGDLEDFNELDKAPDAEHKLNWKVAKAQAPVHTQPDRNSSVVKRLSKGTIVQQILKEGVWVQIGIDQYISVSYLNRLSN